MMERVNQLTKDNLIRAAKARDADKSNEREEYRRTLAANDEKVIQWEEMSYEAR